MALTRITTGIIADNTLAVANIADNAVDATKIASNSILTRHIDDDQITGAQLADNIDIVGTLDVTGATTLDSTLGVTGETTLATHLNMGDGDTIKLGDSADLSLYHYSGSSYIKNDTGSLIFRADTLRFLNNANSEQILHGDANGAVTLYYDNAVKLATASGGVNVTGEVSMTTLDIGGTNVTATATELNYVDGVTSAIQTQMDTKASTGKAIAMAIVFG
jgi:hypothetical protein